MASLSASTAMAWAEPYPVGQHLELEDPEVTPAGIEDELVSVVAIDSTQFDLFFVAMSLQVLFLAGILVTLWAIR